MDVILNNIPSIANKVLDTILYSANKETVDNANRVVTILITLGSETPDNTKVDPLGLSKDQIV